LGFLSEEGEKVGRSRTSVDKGRGMRKKRTILKWDATRKERIGAALVLEHYGFAKLTICFGGTNGTFARGAD